MTEPHDTTETFRRAQTATVRALAGERDLEVSFSSATAPHGTPGRVALPGAAALDALRGVGDYLALKHRFHDGRVHRLYLPRGNPARDVFAWLEDARLAAIGACRWPGVALNLDASLEADCRKASLDLIDHKSAAPLGIALGLLARESLSGRPLPGAAENVARFWRSEVQARAGEVLQQMQCSKFDQARYAEQALHLISLHCIEEQLQSLAPSVVGRHPEADEQAQSIEESRPKEEGPMSQSEAGSASPDGSTPGGAPGDGIAETMGANQADLDREVRPILSGQQYRIFTKAFDRVVHAEDLCGGEELDSLRAELDRKVKPLQHAVQQLANRLQRTLLSIQRQQWIADQSEGILDCGRLASVVAGNVNADIFKREKDALRPGTVLTILIDSSGSMRGNPIATAAMCADIFGRAMTRCTVKVEILGFSTLDWRGGKSCQRWLSSSRPMYPGRLNDLLHVIYKGADEPWRKGRRRLGLLMREDLLKENVDGEALMWAYQRLLARSESRRILMVISDGIPMDTTTIRENGDTYLEQHLRTVIDRIEKNSLVELVAIGIGHDVTRYYSHAVQIRRAAELGPVMQTELAALFGQQGKGAGGSGRIVRNR